MPGTTPLRGLYDDLTIEDLSYFAPARASKSCLFFCQQFLSLDLELVEDNLGHDLVRRMADKANDTTVLTLLDVGFFFSFFLVKVGHNEYRDDEIPT